MKLKVIQIKSVIDRPKDQKLTIEALGLGRPNYSKIHNDTPQIRGMVNKVSHLVFRSILPDRPFSRNQAGIHLLYQLFQDLS